MWDFAVSAPLWCPAREAVHASCHHCVAVLLLLIKAGVEWCNLEVQMFRSLGTSDQGEYLDIWTSSQLLLDFVGPKGAEDCRWLSARLSACLVFFQMLSKPSETLVPVLTCVDPFYSCSFRDEVGVSASVLGAFEVLQLIWFCLQADSQCDFSVAVCTVAAFAVNGGKGNVTR